MEALVKKKHLKNGDLVQAAKRPCTYWRATVMRRKMCVLDRGEQWHSLARTVVELGQD